jgi:serine/threonine protein kinase
MAAMGSSISPGQVLNGRFEVSGVAVADGFGQVLAAVDRKMSKPVSLRLVRGSAVAAVRHHLKLLGALSHPNVLPTFGVILMENGDGLIVQGPLGGHQLGDYVAKRVAGGRPMSLRGAYNVIAHVCNALTALHPTGPHGAVRPSSVWISDDGKVQLSDAIIARALLSMGGTGGLPEAEAGYLAPEIKTGHAPQPGSDIFGVGSLLYVLLTGRSPMQDFVPPSQVHQEATPQLDGELFRALSPDPSQRHASPDALRSALLGLMGGAKRETTEDFGVDIEIEVNLASVAPRSSGTHQPVEIPKAPRLPSSPSHERISATPPGRQSGVPGALGATPGGAPSAGMRVSLADDFRVSVAIDDQEAEAARNRSSLGQVDLKDVLAKITEDDAPRWMVVKNGMDHGPFSGRQLVNMIVQGEALRDHELLNTDSGQRGKIGQFPEFQEFLSQQELRNQEAQKAQALKTAESSEKKSAFFKVGVGLAAVAVIALAGGFYAYTRSRAERMRAEAEGDLYKRGQLEIAGSAGILPMPKRGARRGGGGGASGGGLSYEDAMMQAVDLGNAEGGGGEAQLSQGTVAGVMNKNLNGIFNACIRGAVGTVKIDMAIAGSGQVVGVSVSGGDGGVQNCVAGQVRRIRFPSFSAPRMGARFTFGT